jgi:hypothetical protein
VSVFGDTFARPDRQGPDTMEHTVEACPERVCDHVRRSLAGIGNLLMETGRNTVKEIDPVLGLCVGLLMTNALGVGVDQ